MNMLSIFDMYHLNGGLFLKVNFLLLALTLLESITVSLPLITISASL